MKPLAVLIAELLGDTTNARPLRGLTKAELFQVPAQDESIRTQMAFSQELLARRDVYMTAMKALGEAQDAIAKGKRRVATAKNADDLKIAEKYRAWTEAEIVKARARVNALAKNEGALSGEEVQLYFQRKHTPEFDAMIKQYMIYELFKAQHYSWEGFLAATPADKAHDTAAFTQLQAMADATDLATWPEYLEAKAMYLSRVFPDMAWRRRYTDEHGNILPTSQLSPKEEADYWTVYREWHRHTILHGWNDPSGRAADDPKFQEFRDQRDRLRQEAA